MMTRQLIYNTELEAVAARLLWQPESEPPVFEMLGEALAPLLKRVQSELSVTKRFSQHLICPAALRPHLENTERSLQSVVAYYDDAAQGTESDQVMVLDDPQQLVDIASKSAAIWLVDAAMALASPPSVEPILERGQLIFTGVDDYATFAKLSFWQPAGVQGDFIETPERVHEGDQIPANKQAVLNLIYTLTKPDVSVDEVTDVIKADNTMSYQLLRILNSPIFRGLNQISSIQQAVIRFGLNNVKQWAMMLSMSSVAEKPASLMRLTLLRATMCAKLAEQISPAVGDSDVAYTVGLLSTLSAFVDCSAETLFEATNLKEEVKQAMLTHQGPLGEILAAVIAFQHGQPSSVGDASNLMQCYIDAVAEVGKIFGSLQGG